MTIKMKQMLFICIAAALFFSGCSEREETVIRKIKNIPAEDISDETLPLALLTPEKGYETTRIETGLGYYPLENLSFDSGLSENTAEQTRKTIGKSQAGKTKNKNLPEIKSARSPIFIVPGECLVYRIKWNFSNVGKLILVCKKEQIDKQDIYHLVAITVPEGLWTKFGYGYNRFDSYIDSKTNLPFYYYGYSASSSKSSITKTFIDQEKKSLTYEVKKYKAGKQYGSKNGSIRFSGTIFDGLSAFYAVRGISGAQLPPTTLSVGTTKITTLFLNFVEQNTDNFSVGMRDYWLFQLEASGEEMIFSKGKLFLSISADSEKFPLLLKGKVPFGTAVVDLVSKKNLGPDFPTDTRFLTDILVSTL